MLPRISKRSSRGSPAITSTRSVYPVSVPRQHLWNRYSTGRTNTVVKTVSGVRYEITDLLYLNASLNYDWEAEPAGTAKSSDLALVVGVGVEF